MGLIRRLDEWYAARRGPEVDHTALDELLSDLFCRPSAADLPAIRARLRAAGPEAQRRMHRLYATNTPPRMRALIAEWQRESVDLWTAAFDELARLFPAEYIDALPRRLSTTEAVIVAGLDDPRVVGVLRTALHSSDWLVRLQAATGLLGRPEPEAYAVLREALDDREFQVWRVAVVGVARRDLAEARHVLDRRLPDVPAHLRSLADLDLADLRAGTAPPLDRLFP